ncbi:MAG: UDP-glucose 4-epimerase GalE [Betaproteobacteria bacterium]|nr:UDP-glucose 4-epimerase GalE [Betaproteobacteria bacterium]
MKVLVVGGAGYIGAHMVDTLVQAGHEVSTLDNFSTGHREAVLGGDIIEGDLADRDGLRKLFSVRRLDAVMHFAASALVGESVANPALYYRNNVSNTLNLLEAMVEAGVRNFVFSSTAAVFGEPESLPIDEAHPKHPINPYGRTKRMVEEMLGDFDAAYGLRSVSLRYFNAAGADPAARIGERHDPETHLIPLVLQAASGRRACVRVFGRDYDTRDGTCVRDYIHVLDLCQAHLLALDHLRRGGESTALNLGNGDGYSVQEVIDVARRVSDRPIRVEDADRRAGDPARLVADASAARRVLGWAPRFGDLETIVTHAWNWELGQAGVA